MISPTLDDFLKLAEQGNLIPVTCRILADIETPLSAYRKIRGQGESFLFENPSQEGIRPTDAHTQFPSWEGLGVGSSDSPVRDGLEVVERVMNEYRPVAMPGLPRFTGGAVGFIGYEFIHDVEPVVPRPPHDELQTPAMVFLIADQLLIFDRVAQTLTVLVNAAIDEATSPTDAYENAVSEIERLLSLLEQPSEHHPVSVPGEVPSLPFTSNVAKEKFLANVQASKKFITAGDIIQVVGSQRFSVETKASPVDVYRAARSVLDGFSLVGASPEIHVRCEDRKVEIRPIAGTRRRGKTPAEDAALEKELLADPKERAEHVMHIVSSVEGKLSAGKTPYDLMRATFPAGTVSGAPKIRAMQIICDLEGTTRGPYAGCVGYFSFNGNLDTCITIRTALLKDGKACVQAGGGWVNDSEPEAEFQETVNKSKAMLKAVALAETFGVKRDA